MKLDDAHALVIGIARYKHVNPLPPVKDAGDIAALLKNPAQGAYGGEVELLLDEQATRPAIRKALAALAKRSSADSVVFIYFSGHGGRIEKGKHAGQYLLPIEAKYPDDEALAKSAISGDEFTTALKEIKARKLVVVFDCCHSGGIGQPRDVATPRVLPGIAESYYDELKAGRGRVILASSRTSEFSYVLPGADYGLFTQHLLAGLRGGIASEDGFIRIFDLFEYVQPLVTAGHPEQHPVFKAELEDNFAVALYLGGKKGVVKRDDQGYRYDAYISFADKEPDSAWVWGTLVPRLEKEGLQVAVSGEAELGVARVVGVERGIQQSKRTVVVLSPAFLDDGMADFEGVVATTMGIEEGAYRLLPVKIAPFEEKRLPGRYRILVTANLTHPQRAEREFDRLVKALQGPVPRRG